MKREISPLKKHIEESPKLRELKRSRRKTRNRTLELFAVLFFVLFGAFIFAARYSKLQITTVAVAGNEITDTSDVVSSVDTILSGDYAYVIPYRNAYLYPKNAIVAGLMKSFPQFSSVTVYRTNLNTILVTVSEVHDIALWCGQDIDTIDTTVPCYFTDNTGKIVGPAPHYSGDVYQRFFGSTLLSADENPLGQMFVSTSAFQSLLAFAQNVINLGFQIQAIRIGPGDEDAFVLDLGGGNTALVEFLAADDYDTLAGNLAAALGKPELAEQLKKDKANLQYFDLRFTDKVYYKFSDQS